MKAGETTSPRPPKKGSVHGSSEHVSPPQSWHIAEDDTPQDRGKFGVPRTCPGSKQRAYQVRTYTAARPIAGNPSVPSTPAPSPMIQYVVPQPSWNTGSEWTREREEFSQE